MTNTIDDARIQALVDFVRRRKMTAEEVFIEDMKSITPCSKQGCKKPPEIRITSCFKEFAVNRWYCKRHGVEAYNTP